EHLGLDSDEVVRRFKNRDSGVSPEINLDFPEPIPEPGIPGGAIVFVGIVIAVLAYAAWYINTTKNGPLVELISPLPERLAGPAPAETARPAPGLEPPEVTEMAAPPDSGTATQPETTAMPEPASPAGTAAQTETASTAKPAAEPETGTAVEAGAPAPSHQEARSETQPEAQPEAQPETQPEAPGAETASLPAETPSTAEPEPPAETPAAETAMPSAAEPAPPAEAPAPAPAETAAQPVTPATGEPAPAAETAVAEVYPPPKPAAETPTVEASASPPPETAPTPGLAAVPVDLIPASPAPDPAETAAVPVRAPTETPAAAPAGMPGGAAREASQPETAPGAQKAPATKMAAAVPGGDGAQGAQGRIVVRARTNSWIQVRDDAGGQLLVTRLLRAGDSYAVPDRPGLKLSTGNAGALEILVDGEPVPAIGEEGTVRRNVALDAEKLKAGTAVGE
ncbi:MAG: RodZ domain-containing protein, partial [Rhodospirillales bacterium]